MKKVYMYAHGGSGNHGCEAIVRSTVKILKTIGYDELILISACPEEDKQYGIDEICKIVKDKQPYSKLTFDFFRAYYRLKVNKDYISMDELAYNTTISNIQPGDLVLSIGGDNYCYADVKKYIMLHNMMLKRGAVTVLWGCSVEPSLVQNPEIAKDLAKYSLIVARESITYEALKAVNKNTILVSDPAFFLESKQKRIDKKIVGINLSPMVINKEKKQGIAMQCYRRLIQYILDNTDMDIMLIPHVLWKENDDRIPLGSLYDEFKYSNRVELVEDCSCEDIKGIIAKCHYFVGARTHATIAAYSSGVPTLVVGYSVKARGIAKDIFGELDKFIIPVQSLQSSDDLLNEYKKMIKKEPFIKEKLYEYRKFVEEGLDRVRIACKALED